MDKSFQKEAERWKERTPLLCALDIEALVGEGCPWPHSPPIQAAAFDMCGPRCG